MGRGGKSGRVAHSLLTRLRKEYEAMYSRTWPHDDDYLKLLWRRAIEENPADRMGFNIDRHNVTLNAMRENDT